VAAALGLYGWWKLGEFPTRKPAEEKSGPTLTAEISAAQAILRTAETYRSLIDENKRLSDQLDRYKASEQREEVRKLQTQLSDVQSRLQTANRMLISGRGEFAVDPTATLPTLGRCSTTVDPDTKGVKLNCPPLDNDFFDALRKRIDEDNNLARKIIDSIH
jgi:hypothetical protein